jgi:hypothetical protein
MMVNSISKTPSKCSREAERTCMKSLRNIIVLVNFVNCAFLSAKEFPILLLIAPPRTMSTLFLRAMAERGDLTILHEPGICAFNYFCGYSEELLSSMWRDDAIKTLPEVGAHILKFATQKPVFVKEMHAQV